MCEFFLKDNVVSSQKIKLSDNKADIRNNVADRIYDIRCKIVHTKSGDKQGEVELLLPYSKEAESLYYDIGLMKYITRKVLIAASSTLNISM